MRCHDGGGHSGYKNGAKQSKTVHAVVAASRKLFVVFGLENLATTIVATILTNYMRLFRLLTVCTNAEHFASEGMM